MTSLEEDIASYQHTVRQIIILRLRDGHLPYREEFFDCMEAIMRGHLRDGRRELARRDGLPVLPRPTLAELIWTERTELCWLTAITAPGHDLPPEIRRIAGEVMDCCRSRIARLEGMARRWPQLLHVPMPDPRDEA